MPTGVHACIPICAAQFDNRFLHKSLAFIDRFRASAGHLDTAAQFYPICLPPSVSFVFTFMVNLQYGYDKITLNVMGLCFTRGVLMPSLHAFVCDGSPAVFSALYCPNAPAVIGPAEDGTPLIGLWLTLD